MNADFDADLRGRQDETAKISAGSLLPQSAKISVPFFMFNKENHESNYLYRIRLA
jgi:hypothetical protein